MHFCCGAVAYKKYFYHYSFSSFIALICRVLRRFARVVFCGKIVKKYHRFGKTGQNAAYEAVKRSQNVVKGGVFYYSGYFEDAFIWTAVFADNFLYIYILEHIFQAVPLP